MTLGEISGWRLMLEHDYDKYISKVARWIKRSPGGTAVGTGPMHQMDLLSEPSALTSLTKKEFITAPNKFHFVPRYVRI